jgi:hypothetical protein
MTDLSVAATDDRHAVWISVRIDPWLANAAMGEPPDPVMLRRCRTPQDGTAGAIAIASYRVSTVDQSMWSIAAAAHAARSLR